MTDGGRSEFTRFAFLFIRVLSRHFYKPAKRQGGYTVVGLSPPETDESRTETD